MVAMWKQEMYCPRYSDVRLLPCPKPPTKPVLISQVNKAIVAKFGDDKKCLQTSANRGPTNRWLLDVLATLEPAHINFVKGYSHEKAPVMDDLLQLKVRYLKMLDDMSFPVFAGLPLSLVIKRKSLKSVAFTAM